MAVSCGVGHRCGLDPVLQWLWGRPAAAGPIQPLAWELPYAQGAAPPQKKRSSCGGSVVSNPITIHAGASAIPGLTQWVKDLALP